MERMLTTEEKIRRAEEIYNKRQNANYRKTTATVSVNDKKEIRLFKKMILQILVCLLIYICFYVISNKEYIFSQTLINKSKEILAYDINFEGIYNYSKTYISEKINEINNYFNNMKIEESEEKKEENQNIQENSTTDNNEKLEENNVTTEETQKTQENNENIGGAEEIKNQNDEKQEETSSINQMQIDSEEIKKNIKIIKPLEGTITSRFGVRNPTVSTVSKYHTGIDIAAKTGTKIKSATDGIVELASSEGDYRKSFKDNKWRCYVYICTLQ